MFTIGLNSVKSFTREEECFRKQESSIVAKDMQNNIETIAEKFLVSGLDFI